MSSSHGRLSFCALWVLFTLFALCGCSGSKGTPPASQSAPSAKLVKLADNVALERWLKAELVKSYQYRDLRYYYAAAGSGGTTGVATIASTDSTSTATATAPQAAGSGAADSHSSTNVQELGVDEGDLVKTDGSYIYLARGSHFLIMKGQPAGEAAVVSDIDLKERVSELHLVGSRVTVITTPNTGVLTPVTSPVGVSGMAGAPAAGTSMTGVVMPVVATTRVYNYDISTPAAPVLSSRFEFPGSLQGSRRINNTIYLITNHHIDLSSPVSAWDYMTPGSFSMESYNQASAKASAENLARIDALTLAEMIPTAVPSIPTGLRERPAALPWLQAVISISRSPETGPICPWSSPSTAHRPNLS
jgi:uncharacterized secreted protein with C-terminal beta-propeller domain